MYSYVSHTIVTISFKTIPGVITILNPTTDLTITHRTTTRITNARQENKCAYRCAPYYPIIAIQQRRPHGKLHSEVIDTYLNPIEYTIT